MSAHATVSGRPRRTAARLTAALVCAAGLAAALPEPASAWRLFSLIGYDVGASIRDVAPLPDGTMLIARRDQVHLRGLDGRETPFAGHDSPDDLGDGGPAVEADLAGLRRISVAPDGAVLIAARNLIRRVAPDGTISTVAGTVERTQDRSYGIGGYSGDGGLATSAHLCAPSDVASLPHGGFLIADAGNAVIRRVAPDGTIATVAGVHDSTREASSCGGVMPDGPTSGDGGPATAARLANPATVAPLADGGFLILDYGNSHEPPPAHVRRVDGAGRITTVPGITAPESVTGIADGGYAVSSDAGVLLAGPDGSLTPIGGGGQRPSELFGLEHDAISRSGLFNGEGRDARTIGFGGEVAPDPLGGFVLFTGYGPLSTLAEPPSGRMGIAIRRMKRPGHSPELVYVATASGTLTMSVRVGRRRVGSIRHAAVEPGMATLPVPDVPPGAYELTVRAVGTNGTRDSDRLGVVLGGRLPIGTAAVAIANFECDCTGDAPDTTEYLGRCRRFSRTRVDCRINARELNSCEYVGSAVLRRSGFVWTQTYGCPMRSNSRGGSKPSAAPLL